MEARETLAERGSRSQGLVTKRQLHEAGVSEGTLVRALRRGDVVRVRRAVYALEPLPVRSRVLVTEAGVAPSYVAHVRAALLSLGGTATACGRTAAALRGWPMLVEPSCTLDVAVRHGRSHVDLAGAVAEQRRHLARVPLQVPPGADPLWVSTSLRTVVDCALRLPLLEAVVVCDSALRAGDVLLEDLESVLGRLPGVREARRVGPVLALADGRAASVLESVQRVRMVLGGIDGFDLQVVVRDLPGSFLRVDFCFPTAGLVVEVDGARWHPVPVRDQARDNALAALGWRTLRFSWTQVVHHSEQVLDLVRAALVGGGPRFHLRNASAA
jgi:very-short-patch-repair endonuclease